MDISNIYKPRKSWSKKGDFGHLLVVGGSKLYSGSPIFNALSAYRAGCDLVKIAAPIHAAKIIKGYLPDMIAYPLKGDFLSPKHVKQILEMQKDADAMVIGGGLGRSSSTMSACSKIIAQTRIPAVIDADALYAVHSRLSRNFILTPHTYEFFILTKKMLGSNLDDRKTAVKQAAVKFGCTVLLKGHVDIVSDGIRVAKNSTGSSFMTKGGFGDTLAGICGALLARKIQPFDAALVAAYINGKAGELAVKKFGEGVMASDLMNEISNVIKSVKNQ